MEERRKRENKIQQHCEWCMLIIKHLRDGVILISDISKDPNSADKIVTTDLTMHKHTRTLRFYYIISYTQWFFNRGDDIG